MNSKKIHTCKIISIVKPRKTETLILEHLFLSLEKIKKDIELNICCNE